MYFFNVHVHVRIVLLYVCFTMHKTTSFELSEFTFMPTFLVVAKVTVPYTAVKDNQLSLEQGQLIHVLEQDSSGWWKGQLHVSIQLLKLVLASLVLLLL